MKPISVLLAALLAAPLSAFAQDDACERYPQSSYDNTFCFSKLLIESDKELNQVYQDLRGRLTTQTRQDLTQVQREWMRYRNTVCQDKPGTILVDCNYRVNRARVEYLRDRLRECKTGNCRTNMISRESW